MEKKTLLCSVLLPFKFLPATMFNGHTSSQLKIRLTLIKVIFLLLGAMQQPSSVCEWHQCPRLAPGPAGELLVCSCLLQSGLQRSIVAEGKRHTKHPCYYLSAVPIVLALLKQTVFKPENNMSFYGQIHHTSRLLT